MPRTRRESDEQFVRRVMDTLAWSQGKVAARLGRTQSSISWIFTRGTRLSKLDRLELERALAEDAAVRYLTGEEPVYPEHTHEVAMDDVLPGEFFEHLTTCPRCLVQAFKTRLTD